jgi:hypothetical protein
VAAVQEAERLSMLNRAITIDAEEPVDGGAPTRYTIRVAAPAGSGAEPVVATLKFQEGVVGRNGEYVNGISDEALLEILIHRIKAFQAGPWATRENVTVLDCLTEALAALLRRTTVRQAAGVEGTTDLGPEESPE